MKKIYLIFFALLFLIPSMNAQQIWDNFEDIRKGTYGFISGTFIPYGANPDPSGANTSEVAASYFRNAAELFDVIVLDAPMADLSDYLSGSKQMSMDVWSPTAGLTVQITLENSTLALPDNFPGGRHSVYLATTTVANAWETLTFTFDNQPDASVDNSNVDRLVLLFAPNTNAGDNYFWDNLNAPELADDPCAGVTPSPAVLNDFECNQNVNYTFSHSGVNFRRVLNPDTNGNTSDYVGAYTRNGGEEVDVIIGQFDGNLSLNADNGINIDVWDPNAPTLVRLSLQNANGDEIIAMDAMTSNSGAWETLSFDPSSVSAATDIAQFVLLFDPGSFSSDQYYFDNFGLTGTVSIEEVLEEITAFQAFPNPSQGITTFQYELATAANVSLHVYDLTGKAIAEIINTRQIAGTYTTTWNADQIANGLYFYTLSVNGKVASGKITLNK